MSLNNLAISLSDLGRREDALTAAQEAVSTLRPHFLKFPHAHAPNMQVMANNYSQRCEQLSAEPDMNLLQPIVEVFEQLFSVKR